MVGWGGSVTLVRHNLSIIPLAEHNFEHGTLVSRVTPESIILYFSSINRQTLILGKKNRRRERSRRGKQKASVLASALRCRMISIQFSSLLAEALTSELLPGGGTGTWRKKLYLYYPTDFLAQISCTQYWLQRYNRPKSYIRCNLISRPKRRKPNQENRIYRLRQSVRALSHDI